MPFIYMLGDLVRASPLADKECLLAQVVIAVCFAPDTFFNLINALPKNDGIIIIWHLLK